MPPHVEHVLKGVCFAIKENGRFSEIFFCRYLSICHLTLIEIIMNSLLTFVYDCIIRVILMVKHFFFVDDSGSKNWETPFAREFIEEPPSRDDRNLGFWRGNYFVLAGIHVTGEKISEINPKLNQMKVDVFGTKHVEIKSVWLRIPEKRKKFYLDKFPVSEEDLVAFVKSWYNVLHEYESDIQIQAFVLDKRHFGERKRSEHSPLQILSQVLFDRVELHPSVKASIVFDQMEGRIKSVRHEQGDIIKISDKVLDLGSFHEKYSHASSSFERSSNSNFLQMADTVAYNIFRQFVTFGHEWRKNNIDAMSSYEHFEKIKPNFYKREGGSVAGSGLVKIPRHQDT